MSTAYAQYLSNVAQYLKTPVGKISKQGHLFLRVNNKQLTTGIINIIFSLLRESNSSLGADDLLEEAQIHQWLEYTIVYVGNINSNSTVQVVLKELNTILRPKTYLVNNRLTIADVFMYYVLLKVMASLSTLDKEKYLNVSRWFDNIQQDAELRQKNNLVDFKTNYLANIVPARH